MAEFVLPEKYSEDLVDENGEKMSKRYVSDACVRAMVARREAVKIVDRRSLRPGCSLRGRPRPVEAVRSIVHVVPRATAVPRLRGAYDLVYSLGDVRNPQRVQEALEDAEKGAGGGREEGEDGCRGGCAGRGQGR